MRLADVAPRLALARDQWNAQQALAREIQEIGRTAGWKLDGDTTCPQTGKLRYRTQASAERMMTYLRANKDAQRVCRAYECQFCAGWHLTSKPERAEVQAA